MEIAVETAVIAVTVYPDRARVTCEGSVDLDEGRHRLLVDELPLVMETESLRAGGRGIAQVQLLGVDAVSRHYEQTPSEKVHQLETDIEQLEDEERVLTDRLAGWQAQAQYLDGLRAATVQYAKGLAKGKMTVEDQQQLIQFLREQDTAVRDAVRQLEQEKRQLQRRLQKRRADLKALQSAQPRQRHQARIDVEVLSPGEFTLSVNYVVGKAGWRPLYDVRLLANGDSSERELSVGYLAEVFQQTGQDWLDVVLTVSTARPARSQRLPERHPWYLDVYEPPQPVRRPQAGAAMPAAAMQAEPEAAEVEKREAVVATAALETTETAVRFRVGGNTDVPSDGSTHKNTLHQFRLDPHLDFITVPCHTDAVFRRARVTNTSGSPLLPGTANLFVGDEFIGRSQLDYTAIEDEIELLLGVEEQITVERELSRRDVDKRLLRDVRQLHYGYAITLRNLLDRQAEVTVQDQIPVARNEQITVKLDQAKPSPAERSELNLIEWQVTLVAGAEETIYYEYLVQYPRSVRITGLRD